MKFFGHDNCPICGTKLDITVDMMDHYECERHEYCLNKHYCYDWGYGSGTEYIDGREVHDYYTDTMKVTLLRNKYRRRAIKKARRRWNKLQNSKWGTKYEP